MSPSHVLPPLPLYWEGITAFCHGEFDEHGPNLHSTFSLSELYCRPMSTKAPNKWRVSPPCSQFLRCSVDQTGDRTGRSETSVLYVHACVCTCIHAIACMWTTSGVRPPFLACLRQGLPFAVHCYVHQASWPPSLQMILMSLPHISIQKYWGY